MYGDTELIHRRARELRDQAADVRLLADQLVARTEGLRWSGRAAGSMRERVADRATHLRRAASDHETAADSLDKHATDAATVAEAIAEIESRAETLVAEARTRAAQLDDGVPTDPDDRVLLAFDPPPGGHVDWLDVELPGL